MSTPGNPSLLPLLPGTASRESPPREGLLEMREPFVKPIESSDRAQEARPGASPWTASRWVADSFSPTLPGGESGVHGPGDSHDGLAGEDAEAARGVFGQRSGRRGQSDPGKPAGEGWPAFLGAWAPCAPGPQLPVDMRGT